MKRISSGTILAAAAASVIWITLSACPALAGQCFGSKKLGMTWTERSMLAKVSLSATHCDPVAACLNAVSTGDLVLTASPIVLTVTDALGQTFTMTVDTGPLACVSTCMETKKGTCPGGSETYYGLGGRRLRYTFGQAGQVGVAASKLPLPALTSPNLTPPILMNLLDGNGYSLDMRANTCITKQKLGSYSVRCY